MTHYVALSLLLFTGLEIILSGRFQLPLSFLFFFLVILAGIILIRSEEKKLHMAQLILPSLATLSFVAFALFLPPSRWLHVYFAGCGLLFFFILRYGARLKYPTWNWMLALIVYFFSMAAMIGWRFYFYIPLVLMLVLIFLVTWLISWQALTRAPRGQAQIVLITLVLALVMSQLGWTLQFLPLHHLAQASLLTILFYAYFHLIRVALWREVGSRDILEYAGVSGVAAFIIVVSSQWI